LLAALRDPDHWVRYFAARSVGRHANPESVAALEHLAHNDEASPVRIAAMESLAQIGGARVVAILAPLIDSADPDIARAALGGLGLIGHPDALLPLLAALRARDAGRRIDALRALGNRDGTGAAEAIQWVAAGDADEKVAEAAIDSLCRLATPEAIDMLVNLTSDPARREASVAALARLGRQRVHLIGKGLNHPQTSVRRSIVDALGRMKQPEASEWLGIALDDPDPSVRLAAVTALAHLGSRSAERKLVSMARTDSDPTVRRAAQKALRK
jgi:HEAT repeat protein